MSKINTGMLRFLGNVQGLTFVNSAAYDAHWRARRGTYRKVYSNKTLIGNSRRTALLNQTAKAVFDVLKISGKSCRDMQLWQRMLSRLRKCSNDEPLQLLQQLEGLDLHRSYSLQKLFINGLDVQVVTRKRNLLVELKATHHPIFPKPATDYRFEVQVLYYHTTKNVCSYETCFSDWMALNEAPALSLLFPKKKALCCLIAVRIQPRTKFEIVESFWGNRMCVVKVVRL